MMLPGMPRIAGVIITVALSAAYGQQQGNINKGPSFGGTGPGSEIANMPRPIFLNGKVVLEDGMPLVEPVMIEQVCQGVPVPQGYTDLKGKFSFQLGQNPTLFADASSMPAAGRGSVAAQTNPTYTEAQVSRCEIRAVLPGYTSMPVSLFSRRLMDDPDLGTIVLHRMANVEGSAVSATSSLAPNDARKAYEKATEALKKDKVDEAQKELMRAVELYPKYAVAWVSLAKVYEREKDTDRARKAYMAAISADAKFVRPYEGIYMLGFREGKWQEVAVSTDRIIHLDPYDFPQAYYYNAVANINLNKMNVAEASIRELLKSDGGKWLPRANFILGMILAEKKDYAGAAESMRAYLAAAPNAQDADMIRQQIAGVENAAKTAAGK